MNIKMKADYLVVLVLLVAIGGVGVSVYQLQQIFLSENQRSRQLLQDRRDYIEKAAKQLFLEALDREMNTAIKNMRAVIDSPYKSAAGLYWRKNDKQLLPLVWRFSQLPADNAMSYYQQLQSQLSSQPQQKSQPHQKSQLQQTIIQPDDHEDITLLGQLARALQLEDETQIESAARAVMNYDANHRFASRHELVYRLIFVELLASYQQASRDLLTKLLREDLVDDRGSVLPALQKEVLRRRNELNRDEFEFIKNKIVSLSQALQIRTDDFIRAANPPSPMEQLNWPSPQSLSMPTIWRDKWYYFPGESDTYGMTVDVSAIQAAITKILKAQQWLAGEDQLTLTAPDQELVQLEEINFVWQSRTYQQNLTELEDFYRVKQLILLTSVLSLAAAGLLIWLLYRRQARWVGIKSEFVATVAHEMRTPLSGIRLMAERLASTLTGETKAKDYPQRILADIDTLSFLAENILSFERLQSGQWVVHSSPIVMSEVVDELRKELPLFVKKPFTLAGQGDSDCTLYADPILIKLLFLNLAKNSCAYNGNDLVNIQLRWATQDQQLKIDFIDNGIGIPGDERRDSFVPFYRGKAQRHTRGSGLGLALCQKIMVLHGGNIEIKNSDANGTHFTLIFPRQNSVRG